MGGSGGRSDGRKRSNGLRRHSVQVSANMLPPLIQEELPLLAKLEDLDAFIDAIAVTQFPSLEYIVHCLKDLYEYSSADVGRIRGVVVRKVSAYQRAVGRRNINHPICWSSLFAAVRMILPPEMQEVLDNSQVGTYMER